MSKHFTVKNILLFFAFLLVISVSETKAQLTEADWNSIIPLLRAEDWPKAEKMSAQPLKKIKPKEDTMYDASNLRYMYLVSVAGELGHKDIDQKEALKKVKHLVGKRIITPGRKYDSKCIFNCWKVDSTGVFFCCRANDIGTELQIFETFEMNDTTFFADRAMLEQRNFRIMATIKEIKTGGQTFPHFEIRFTDALLGSDD